MTLQLFALPELFRSGRAPNPQSFGTGTGAGNVGSLPARSRARPTPTARALGRKGARTGSILRGHFSAHPRTGKASVECHVFSFFSTRWRAISLGACSSTRKHTGRRAGAHSHTPHAKRTHAGAHDTQEHTTRSITRAHTLAADSHETLLCLCCSLHIFSSFTRRVFCCGAAQYFDSAHVLCPFGKSRRNYVWFFVIRASRPNQDNRIHRCLQAVRMHATHIYPLNPCNRSPTANKAKHHFLLRHGQGQIFYFYGWRS